MRNSKMVFTAQKETDFNIFMSGPEWGQPVIWASDIVKNLMDRRNKKEQPKMSAMENHKYPNIRDQI